MHGFPISLDSQGLGLAIPSDTILREIPNLVNKGSYTEHSWLGVSSINMNYYISTAMNENFTYGVLVAQVAQNGPAQTADIKGETSQVQITGQTYPIGGT